MRSARESRFSASLGNEKLSALGERSLGGFRFSNLSNITSPPKGVTDGEWEEGELIGEDGKGSGRSNDGE